MAVADLPPSLLAKAALPSPALTDPGMHMDKMMSLALASGARLPPSPSYILDRLADPGADSDTPSVQNVGSRPRKWAVQTPQKIEQAQKASVLQPFNSPSAGSETDDDMPMGWDKSALMPRRPSLASSATTFDIDLIPDYKHDGEESDFGTLLLDDESRVTTPTGSVCDEDKPRRRSVPRTYDRTSAELSRRAELVLKNAKRRLQLMDENLKGARALTAENLSQAASLSKDESTYAEQVLARQHTGVNIVDIRRSTRHSRNVSDSTVLQIPRDEQRPVSPAPRTSTPDKVLHAVGSEETVRASSRLPALRTFGIAPPSPNMVPAPLTPTKAHASSTPGSPATKQLHVQMEDLNRRVSLLRDRTRAINLQRKSIYNARHTTPLTDPYTEIETQSDGDERTSPYDPNGPSLSRWSSDSSVYRLSLQLPRTPLNMDFDGATRPERKRSLHRRSKALDWTPVTPTAPTKHRHSLLGPNRRRTEAEIAQGVIPAEASPEDVWRSIEALKAHEDRNDSYNYTDQYMQSRMASEKAGSDTSDRASGNDILGPMSPIAKSSSRIPMLHKRMPSTDSLSSAHSYATAVEGQTPRIMTPIKRPGGSDDSALSGMRSPTRPDKGRLSMHVADQIGLIAAPPAAIAVAAISNGGRRSLGLQEKAFIFMLMESTRKACEKLQDDSTEGAEKMILRQRLEQARKVMDGALVV